MLRATDGSAASGEHVTNFGFLREEFSAVFAEAARAEQFAKVDPRTSCFYSRRALEVALTWVFQYDSSLKQPYKADLSGMIHEPTLRQLVGNDLQAKMEIVRKKGNAAVHSTRPASGQDALVTLQQLFHVLYWYARTYTQHPGSIPASLQFDVAAVPDPGATKAKTQEQLQSLAADLENKDAQLAAAAEKTAQLETQLASLQAQVAAAKAANEAVPDTHDYDEAATRDLFIDTLLEEAGWVRDTADGSPSYTIEHEVAGMPNVQGVGFVDYVLWGADGRPLAVVEAKRTRRNPQVGQQQAKLYADALEANTRVARSIYYTNGHEHWMWDDHAGAGYSPRKVAGFRTRDELEYLIGRRGNRTSLLAAPIDENVAGRYYQQRAIRAIDKAFEVDNQREVLLVMATGSGKTRTVVALVEQLMKAGWVRRVLFLADRVALVNQAANAFKEHLPDSSPVNLVTDRHGEGRVFVSTYPTMMNLIDTRSEGTRKFGPGFFDLVIIDEAHRSVYQKYRALFHWFDALLVGLTATPKDEIDRNTYELFHLENGVPTDAYSLEQAVADQYLVPPTPISVPLKFQREGIRYADLSEAEKDEWDALEWGEDGPPDEVDPDAVNKWLFNTDTVDKVLHTLMTHGLRVAGGDRIAKTIVFAKNDAHARFIAERFDHAYPQYKGECGRVITYSDDVRAVADRQLLHDREGPAHRDQRRHARHRHRRARRRQPRLLQDRPLVVEVLADDRPRHPPPPRPVRARSGQEGVLRLRLLPEPRVLRPEPDRARGLDPTVGVPADLHRPGRAAPRRRRADRRRHSGRERRRHDGAARTARGHQGRAARQGRQHDPGQLRRPSAPALGRAVQRAGGVGQARRADRPRRRRAPGWPAHHRRRRGREGQAVRPNDAEAPARRA